MALYSINYYTECKTYIEVASILSLRTEIPSSSLPPLCHLGEHLNSRNGASLQHTVHNNSRR
jgi:hypothetical protein